MTNDFILYQKFTDVESAEDFAAELAANNIAYKLEDNNHSYVKLVGYNTIDIAVSLNIQAKDFTKADAILEQYYDKQVSDIDRSYHLFSYSDAELQDIITNPYDWGKFDYQLAKHILNERGVVISDSTIHTIKAEQVEAQRVQQKANGFKIILGYLLAILMPVFAYVIAISITYNRKILPNGEKFYINTDSDRRHGEIIMVIATLTLIVFFIGLFARQ
jgi:hypothetical protein